MKKSYTHSAKTKKKISDALRGIKRTEEQKRKQREAMKGKSAWNKGMRGWTKKYPNAGFQKGHGSFTTQEGRKRQGQKVSGDKNPTWRGGAWNYWNGQAKIRDNYTCQMCGFSDKEIMQVDHIKPKSLFPELKKVLDNLMTVCPNCHARKTNREKKLVLKITPHEDKI